MIPLSVLDLSPITEGGTASQSLANTLDLARHAERRAGDRVGAAALGRGRPVEEGDVGPRRTETVGIEEVIGADVVLVDGLLDQPEAEDARVEIDVLRRLGRDRREVMDAGELHGYRLASLTAAYRGEPVRRRVQRAQGRFAAGPPDDHRMVTGFTL